MSWYGLTYVQNALRLCEVLIEEELDKSVYDFRVVVHLAHQAIELSLKAVLLSKGGSYPKTHVVSTLESEFRKSFPELELRIPEYIRQFVPSIYSPNLDLFENSEYEKSNCHRDELERFRFPSNRRGFMYPEPDIPDLELLRSDLKLLSFDILGMHLRISKNASVKNSR